MENAPRCSVIITTYNRVELIRYTLDSLTRQTLPSTQFEVIVVDDGSTDATEELVESYRDRLNLRYFFQEDKGWRVAQARNVGIANATTDICVFIDSGVMLHSGCIAAHVESHELASGPVAVNGYVFGFNLVYANVQELSQIIDADDPDGSIDRMLKGGWNDIRESFYEQHSDDYNHLPAPWVMYWTCNVSAPTPLVRAVGGFDEAFQRWGGEDLDLAYRMFLGGAEFVLNRAASAIHYPHYKDFDENEAQAHINYLYMAQKYPTPIIQLLPAFGPEINPFTINEVIRERGLPNCADYLAEHGAVR
jgi:glycosyltransferase involved in cell wall biosynthesis